MNIQDIQDMSAPTYFAIGLLICAVGMFAFGVARVLESTNADDNGGMLVSFVIVSLFAWPLFAIPIIIATIYGVAVGSYKLGKKFSQPRKEKLELVVEVGSFKSGRKSSRPRKEKMELGEIAE